MTSVVTVFFVRLSRGGQVARELLGETCSGILVTDRSSASNGYPVRWRQVCWAQLLRDCEAIRGRGGVAEEMGDALLAQAHQMFPWWHRVCEGTLTRSTFRSYMSPLRHEVERLVEAGSQCGVPQTAGTCREMLKRHEACGPSCRSRVSHLPITRRRGRSVRVCHGARAAWGSRRNWRHAQHDMTAIISSAGSSQVLCASLDATTVLRVITPHDREGSEVSFHARHERFFLSKKD